MEFKKDLFLLKNDSVTLKIIDTYKGNDNEIPFYWYKIICNDTGETVGKISIRIGHNFHSYYNGNIGYEIDKIFRGHNYAYHACKLALQVAKAHGMNNVYLSCNYDNIASCKTIENLGATLKEQVVPPQEYIFYHKNIKTQNIYILEL